MSQPTPMPAAERSDPEEIYRPISGLAIASLILAAVFGVLVAVNGGAGLLEGMPLMLSSWLLLLPVGGVALSIVAQRQIRSSEGTRAGQRLAVWGLWLSVLFGLGYGAYSVAIYFVVRHQVQEFLFNSDGGFFANLKKLEQKGVNAAFLQTQLPESRGNISDQDNVSLQIKFKQTLMRFLESQIVRVAHQGGADTLVKPQSISAMKYEQGGFVLEVTVELVTPEQTVPFAITVRSKDSSGAGTDKWFVDMTKLRQLGPEVETERGRVLRGLRGLSHEFAVQWLMKLRGRDLPGALKDTIAPSEFVQGGKAIQKTISQEALRKKIDQIFDPAAKDEAAAFDATLGCCLRDARRPSQIPPPPAYWSLNHKKHLEVAHDLSLLFDGDPAKGTRVICMGRVVVERTEGEPFALDPKRLPVWRVARFEITASHTMGPGEGSRERPRR